MKLLLTFLTIASLAQTNQNNPPHITQEQLKSAISKLGKASDKIKTYKKRPVYAFKIETNFNDVPNFIRERIGSLDQATYNEEYLDSLTGGVVVLQIKEGHTDFYPMTKDKFEKNYTEVCLYDVEKENPALALAFKPLLKGELQPLNKNTSFIGIHKPKKVQMVRLSDLNFNTLPAPPTIVSPWGGTQTQDGEDSFIVVSDSPYMVQMETTEKNTNLPTSYHLTQE